MASAGDGAQPKPHPVNDAYDNDPFGMFGEEDEEEEETRVTLGDVGTDDDDDAIRRRHVLSQSLVATANEKRFMSSGQEATTRVLGDESPHQPAHSTATCTTTDTASPLLNINNDNQITEAQEDEATSCSAASTSAAADASDPPAKMDESSLSFHYQQEVLPLLNLPWRKPIYVSPHIQLVSCLLEYGGGRGYVAMEDLPVAGTLVLVEEPRLAWPREQLGRELGLISVLHLLQQALKDDLTLLHEMEHLHPTKAAVDQIGTAAAAAAKVDVDYQEQVTEMMQSLFEHYKEEEELHVLQDILQLIAAPHQNNNNNNKNIVLQNSNGTRLTKLDCLRLLLALRYNGMQSGIYLHVAMLNHSDQPNCVKFLPSSSSTTTTVSSLSTTRRKNNNHDNSSNSSSSSNDKKRNLLFSEVRTTRPVRAGQALTINYLPTLLSHPTRRHDLWEQHRFDIGSIPSVLQLQQMELVRGTFPMSSTTILPEGWNNDDDNSISVTRQVEKATADLRQLYHETTELLEGLQPLSAVQEAAEEESNTMIEQMRALELASLELAQGAALEEKLGNPHHVLLIPCLELHLDCADLVLRFDSLLRPSQRVLLWSRIVSTALHLLELQTMFHGPDHFDLARTNWDLAQAIEQLLGKSPKTLLSLQMERGESMMNSSSSNNRSIAAWSTREHQARTEYKRIRDLYPHDAARYIG